MKRAQTVVQSLNAYLLTNMKMKTAYLLVAIPLILIAIIAARFMDKNQTGEPWTEGQLMPPATLAVILRDSTVEKPVIFNIGPSGSIQGAIDLGAGSEKKSQNKLEKELRSLAKDTDIVVYCGCCPFKDCPNIRLHSNC